MLQNATKSLFIMIESNFTKQLQFNINILTKTIYCSKLISFMCKKLNKLEDVRIFNLLNIQKRTKHVVIQRKFILHLIR